MSSLRIYFLLIIVSLLALACKGPQQLYQENLLFTDSSAVVARTLTNFKEPEIQIADLLFIQVQTADARINALFNNTMQIMNQPSSEALTQGYQVGIDSAINFPVLGKLKVVGLTRGTVEGILVDRVSEYIKEKPSVQVRYLNYKVSILGDVNRPGNYSFPTDRVTIMDALGMAGDLSIFARRNKIWLIREVNNERKFYFIDLQNSNGFNPDTYFLKQNDVVYVEPSRKKFILADPTYNRTAQNISIGLSSVGLIIALVSLLR